MNKIGKVKVGRKMAEAIRKEIGIIWSIWIRLSIWLSRKRDSRKKKGEKESLNKYLSYSLQVLNYT